MADDVRNTGTYQMLVAEGGGVTLVEHRARGLARAAGEPLNWRNYVEAAKAQLLKEAGLSPPPTDTQ